MTPTTMMKATADHAMMPSTAVSLSSSFWSGDRVRAHHLVHGQVEIVEAAPPLVLTAQKGLNEPRYPGLKNILAAKKKVIETIPARIPEAILEIVRLDPPPSRGAVKIVGKGPEAVPELLRALRTEAKVL